MKNFLKKYHFPLICFIYSVLVSLFFTALRINYAGISKFMGADSNPSFIVMNLPIIICVILWLLSAYSLYGLVVYEKKKIHSKLSLFFSILFTVAIGVIIYFGSLDYLYYIVPHFLKSALVFLLLLILGIALFVPTKNNKKTIGKKVLIMAGVVLLCVVVGYNLKSNRFTSDGTVYAVEDEYQIVFSTSDNSIAWVEIDGEKYYDLYAGSMKSKDLVHKITVPQDRLNRVREYTIYAQQMIYRGPFGGYKGDIISVSHEFRPVNTTDGINYYCISDVHDKFNAAYNAAGKIKDLDYLVVLGDITSMVEYHENALATTSLANKITKGEIPVVYARGNHEIKGEYAEDLYKYVGSKDGNFYYTFSLGRIKGIVLDLGEDHDDDWWEYYETARFDLYRDEQTELLKKCLEDEFFKDSEYSMILCHIPIPFVNSRHNHETYKNEWTGIINDLNVDIVLSGHQHDITIFEPGLIKPHTELTYNSNFYGEEGKTYKGYLTDFSFYSFLVGRRANRQTGDTEWLGSSEYTGMHVSVDLKNGKQTVKYTNTANEVVEVCNMFGKDEPVKEYNIPLR